MRREVIEIRGYQSCRTEITGERRKEKKKQEKRERRFPRYSPFSFLLLIFSVLSSHVISHSRSLRRIHPFDVSLSHGRGTIVRMPNPLAQIFPSSRIAIDAAGRIAWTLRRRQESARCVLSAIGDRVELRITMTRDVVMSQQCSGPDHATALANTWWMALVSRGWIEDDAEVLIMRKGDRRTEPGRHRSLHVSEPVSK